MKPVSVSQLKAHLSRFLRLVSAGTAAPSADDQRRQRLIKAGVLRAGSGTVLAVLNTEPLQLPVSLTEALNAEREGLIVLAA